MIHIKNEKYEVERGLSFPESETEFKVFLAIKIQQFSQPVFWCLYDEDMIISPVEFRFGELQLAQFRIGRDTALHIDNHPVTFQDTLEYMFSVLSPSTMRRYLIPFDL